MIWIILFSYLLFGSDDGQDPGVLNRQGMDYIGDLVETTVEDPERASAAKKIAKQAAKDLKQFKDDYVEYGKTLSNLYRDHSQPANEVQTVVDEMNVQWRDAQQQILDAHFAIRESLTKDEWTKVYGEATTAGLHRDADRSGTEATDQSSVLSRGFNIE